MYSAPSGKEQSPGQGHWGVEKGPKESKNLSEMAPPKLSLLHLSLTNYKKQQCNLLDIPAQLRPLYGQCLNFRWPGVGHAELTQKKKLHAEAGKGIMLRGINCVGIDCEGGVCCSSSIYLIIHSLMALRWFLSENYWRNGIHSALWAQSDGLMTLW